MSRGAFNGRAVSRPPGGETDSARSRTRLLRRGPWLLVPFPGPLRVASWAVAGGGLRLARGVAWRHVTSSELPRRRDPAAFLRRGLRDQGFRGWVGFLTACNLDAAVVVEKRVPGVRARCVATVSLTNALRAGDPPSIATGAGTINVLCWVSAPLSREAHLEALALAAEARALGVLESSVPSRRSGRPATGTGTDCIAIAAPPPRSDGGLRYAGKYTMMGHLIGSTVLAAVRRGAKTWARKCSRRGGPR